MKYIRTKDGRILTKKEWEELVEYAESIFQIIDDMVLQQADTIEELCDEFVAVGVPFKTFVIEKSLYENQGLTLKGYVHYLYVQYTNVVVYGAIWTDKGLIYVAKMNSERELELL